MIADMIASTFERIGHRWKTTEGYVQPSEEDVDQVLDEAAKRLYDCGIGDRFETGGLIIEKRPHGHDVWVYLGNYQ